MSSFKEVFSSIPGKTDYIQQDLDVGDATPVKLPPYRISPKYASVMQKELNYMLGLGLISPCIRPWSSPVTLQPKPDGSARFCIDYRRVNAPRKTDTYPLPRLEECIGSIGTSKFISKLNLKQGFWQVPLTDRAREVSCFVVS